MIEKELKLLVVDDNEEIRYLIRMTFKRQPNVKVFEAINAQEGLKHFYEYLPDIVLSDLIMDGEMGGLDLCRQIKASDNKCPVILFSGKGEQNIIDLGMKAGADMYKLKPFSPTELINIVRELAT
jgi:DNA-binding response OmpR family regulator